MASFFLDYFFILQLRDCTIKQEEDQNKPMDVVQPPDVHDVRTRQTRIAMLKMREELHDLTFHDSHHAHEYFVVNSFKLTYSLTADEKDKQDLIVYQKMELPKKLVPIDIEAANKVLDSIKKHAIFPKNPILLDDLKNEILEKNYLKWDDVKDTYDFIKMKAEFGATLHELVVS